MSTRKKIKSPELTSPVRRSPRKSASATNTPTSRNEGDDDRPSTSQHLLLHLPRRLIFDTVTQTYPNIRRPESIARPKSVQGRRKDVIVATVEERNLRSSSKKQQPTAEGRNLRSSPRKLQHQLAGPSSSQGAMLPPPPTSRQGDASLLRGKDFGTTLISPPNRILSKRRREIEEISPPQRQSRRRLELDSPLHMEPVPPRRQIIKQTPDKARKSSSSSSSSSLSSSSQPSPQILTKRPDKMNVTKDNQLEAECTTRRKSPSKSPPRRQIVTQPPERSVTKSTPSKSPPKRAPKTTTTATIATRRSPSTRQNSPRKSDIPSRPSTRSQVIDWPDANATPPSPKRSRREIIANCAGQADDDGIVAEETTSQPQTLSQEIQEESEFQNWAVFTLFHSSLLKTLEPPVVSEEVDDAKLVDAAQQQISLIRRSGYLPKSIKHGLSQPIMLRIIKRARTAEGSLVLKGIKFPSENAAGFLQRPKIVKLVFHGLISRCLVFYVLPGDLFLLFGRTLKDGELALEVKPDERQKKVFCLTLRTWEREDFKNVPLMDFAKWKFASIVSSCLIKGGDDDNGMVGTQTQASLQNKPPRDSAALVITYPREDMTPTRKDPYQLVPFEPTSDFLVRHKSPEASIASGSRTSAQQEAQATPTRRSQQIQANAVEPALIPIIPNPDRVIPASPPHHPPPNAISPTGQVNYDALCDARYFVYGEDRPRVQKTKDRYNYPTLAELHQELNAETINVLNTLARPPLMIPQQRNVYGLVVKVFPQRSTEQNAYRIMISDATMDGVYMRIHSSRMTTTLGPQIQVGNVIRVHRVTVQVERYPNPDPNVSHRAMTLSTSPHLNYVIFSLGNGEIIYDSSAGRISYNDDVDAPRIRQLFAVWKDRIAPTIDLDARFFDDSWDGTTSQTLAIQAAGRQNSEPAAIPARNPSEVDEPAAVAIPSTSGRNPSDIDEPDTTTSSTPPPPPRREGMRRGRRYSPKFHVEPPPYPT